MARKPLGKFKKVAVSICLDPELKAKFILDLEKEGISFSSWIETQMKLQLAKKQKQ